MIIQVRGTSGAGKSHLVRRVMDHYPIRGPQVTPGRRQPLSYLCLRPNTHNLVVVGHYEIECGGCDTIKTLDQALAVALAAHRDGANVLMEGLLASENVGKFAAIKSLVPLHVIALTTPLEACLAAVADRRRRRGNEKPLDPKNTTNRVGTIERACARLVAAGVAVERLDRAAAYERTCALLGLTPQAS